MTNMLTGIRIDLTFSKAADGLFQNRTQQNVKDGGTSVFLQFYSIQVEHFGQKKVGATFSKRTTPDNLH